MKFLCLAGANQSAEVLLREFALLKELGLTAYADVRLADG